MKYLSKYKIFELTTNKVLDLVIDKDGVLHDTHGHIDMIEKTIISDRVGYIAGIDKNGTLFTFEKTDRNGYITINETPLINPISGESWNVKTNYIDLVSKTSTGWVNVKVDMEVIRKVKRYASAIDKRNTVAAFDDKLRALSDTSLLAKNCTTTTEAIQKQMAAIMLLRYLYEIKDYFNPSSSGFLLESFLGGLIPGKVPDDNSEADVIGDDNSTYQIKFVDWNAKYIDINRTKPCDYYIIALKRPEGIYIYRLTESKGIKGSNKMWIGDFIGATREKSTRNGIKLVAGLVVKRLKDIKDSDGRNKYISKLDLSNIDERINKISSTLKGVVGRLWVEISELQYNCETMITGVDKDHKIVNGDDSYITAKNNIDNLTEILGELKGSMDFGN